MSVDAEAARLRHRMVDDLARAGLLPPMWREAFEVVPRHLFLPRYFRLSADHMRYDTVATGDPEWLTGIYCNSVLPTQLDSDNDRWEQARRAGRPVAGTPTCSSTMPSLMASMLDALNVRDGVRVLEIGTGTGYNAALLCHRLGSELVTTIDVDSTLIEQARKSLSAAGYQPTAETRDGLAGYSENSPYDRIIATVSVPAIPRAWLANAAPEAVIVTHLYRDLGGNVLLGLTVDVHGQAEGNVLADRGNFMPVRSRPGLDALARLGQTRDETGDTRPVRAHFTGQSAEEAFFAFAALLMTGVARLDFQPTGAEPQLWLFSEDSWACHYTDSGVVEQHGPLRLWDELEDAYARWSNLGRPDRTRLGLTVTPDGAHRLWLDTPAQVLALL